MLTYTCNFFAQQWVKRAQFTAGDVFLCLRVQWEQRRWRETRSGYSSVDFCCLKSCIGTRSRQTTSRAARKQATEYGVTGCLENALLKDVCEHA